jgi:hypothetical protein
MYIGLKQLRDDRPNARPDRTWAGAGSVVHGIPSVQASKLLVHDDEFIDVTALAANEDELIAKAKEVRELAHRRKQELTSAVSHRNANADVAALITRIDNALFVEELQRRIDQGILKEDEMPAWPALERANKGKSAAAKAKAPGQQKKAGKQDDSKDKPDEDKPGNADEVQTAILEAVTAIVEAPDNAELLDDDGIPTLEAVTERLGYSISEEEFKAALGSLAS